MDIEGDAQEATWKRDAGVSYSTNVEEEHYPSPGTGAGVSIPPLSGYIGAHPNPHLE